MPAASSWPLKPPPEADADLHDAGCGPRLVILDRGVETPTLLCVYPSEMGTMNTVDEEFVDELTEAEHSQSIIANILVFQPTPFGPEGWSAVDLQPWPAAQLVNVLINIYRVALSTEVVRTINEIARGQGMDSLVMPMDLLKGAEIIDDVRATLELLESVRDDQVFPILAGSDRMGFEMPIAGIARMAGFASPDDLYSARKRGEEATKATERDD